MSLHLESTPLGPAPVLDLTALASRARAVDDALRPAFIAHGAAEARLDDLFRSNALCVTTGQQPGLLTGPLYTIYKALSAVALARQCEDALRRPVVPVFWIGGDDHDFAEGNHLYLLTLANAVEKVVLRERAEDAPLTPLYREPVGPEIGAVLDALRAATPETEFRADTLAWIERHYRPDQDLATAFAGAVAELLGPYGVVVFRPTHRAAKRSMAPRLLDTLANAEQVDNALAARAAELAAAGDPVPVATGDGATLVMVEGALGRDRLVRSDGDFTLRRAGERFSLDELRTLAADAPERFSPNVLLRPVIEAALLPTIAYVGGPGERAYLPQTEPLYRLLDVPAQTPVLRWSGRVVESKVAKVLEKYGIDAEALAQPEGQLEASLVRDAMPDEAQDALAVLRETLRREYDRLERAATAIDPTLKKPIASARNNALAGTGDVERRLVSHLKQANDVLVQQLAKARQNLFPLGRPQERVFNAVPYLVRYGTPFLDAVLDGAAAWMTLEAPRARA